MPRSSRSVRSAITAAILFAPSAEARARAIALRRDVIRLTGAPAPVERAKEVGASLLYLANRALGRTGMLQQPGLLRTVHRMQGEQESRATGQAVRLQGGRFTGLGQALLEDLDEHARRLAIRLGICPSMAPLPPAAAVVTRRATGMEPSLVTDIRPRRREALPIAPTCIT